MLKQALPSGFNSVMENRVAQHPPMRLWCHWPHWPLKLKAKRGTGGRRLQLALRRKSHLRFMNILTTMLAGQQPSTFPCAAIAHGQMPIAEAEARPVAFLQEKTRTVFLVGEIC